MQNYVQNSDGFTIFASYPIRHLGFTRVGLTYGLTDTSIQSLSTAATALFDVLQFQSLAGPSSLSGIHSSTITPTLTYNTVDNPVNPTHGKSLFTSFAFEGGPIGGNVNSITQVVEAKYFRPNYHNRNVIAMRFLGAFTTGFSGKVVAPYSRFYLGGETDLRGFDVRTVSPVVFIPQLSTTAISFTDPTRLGAAEIPTTSTISIPTLSYQTSFPGGDTQVVMNLEYRIPLFPHVSLSLFADAGATGALREESIAAQFVRVRPRCSSSSRKRIRSRASAHRCRFNPERISNCAPRRGSSWSCNCPLCRRRSVFIGDITSSGWRKLLVRRRRNSPGTRTISTRRSRHAVRPSRRTVLTQIGVHT